MILSQGKVEKFSGLPGPPLVPRSQKAENGPLAHRLTEADRLVPRMARGIWEPSCCQRGAQCVVPELKGAQETVLWAQVSPG